MRTWLPKVIFLAFLGFLVLLCTETHCVEKFIVAPQVYRYHWFQFPLPFNWPQSQPAMAWTSRASKMIGWPWATSELLGHARLSDSSLHSCMPVLFQVYYKFNWCGVHGMYGCSQRSTNKLLGGKALNARCRCTEYDCIQAACMHDQVQGCSGCVYSL